MSIIKLILRWVIMSLPLLYMAFIWYLSGQPSNSVIELGMHDSLIKESLHLVEFAILYSLLILAFLVRGELTNSKNWLAVMVSVAYAFIDELHQFFIPSRSASVIDIIKDLIGIGIAWYFIRQVYFKNSQSKAGRLLHMVTNQFNGKYLASKNNDYKDTGR